MSSDLQQEAEAIKGQCASLVEALKSLNQVLGDLDGKQVVIQTVRKPLFRLFRRRQ